MGLGLRGLNTVPGLPDSLLSQRTPSFHLCPIITSPGSSLMPAAAPAQPSHCSTPSPGPAWSKGQAPATRPVPLNDEVDAVPLLQDPLQLGDPVGAGTLKGDLVRDAHDLHGLRVAGDLSVGDGDHVVQAQGFRWGSNGKAECKTEPAGQQGPGRGHLPGHLPGTSGPQRPC